MVSDKKENSLAQVVSDITDVAHGLPPGTKRNFFKALARLTNAALDIPIAKLEAVASEIQVTQKAKNLVKMEAAKAVAARLGADENLTDRAITYFAANIVNEQNNREKILGYAQEELQASPPSDEPKDVINEDWLNFFSTEAAQKSSGDMQVLFGKILAGEIKNPGTFSIKSIQTLSHMSQSVAQLFMDVCNISICIPAGNLKTFVLGLGRDPSSNGLKEFNLYYSNLLKLQEFGLIANNMNSTVNLNFLPKLRTPFDYAGHTSWLSSKPEHLEESTLAAESILFFSEVGHELRKIVSMKRADQYKIHLVKYLDSKNIEVYEEISREGTRINGQKIPPVA